MSNQLRSPSAKVKSGPKAPDKPRDSDRAVIERWYRSPRDYRPLAVVLAEARRDREAQR